MKPITLIYLVAVGALLLAIGCGEDEPTQPSSTTGKISGKVIDLRSDGIPDVQITTVPATSSILTSSDGSFTLSAVPPGSYVVTALKSGYASASVTVAVSAGATARADLQLGIAGNNAPPLAPHSPRPTSGAVAQSTDLTLQWISIDPDGDSLQFDVLLGTVNPPTATVSTAQRQSAHYVSGLDSGVTYYWQIVARDSRGASTVGPVWHFRTYAFQENRAPAVPSQPSPADGAIKQDVSVTLSWSCTDPEGDLLKYDVYFGTSENPEKLGTNLPSSSFVRTGLVNSTVYYWRVIARDNHGGESAGPLWSFMTSDTVVDPTPTPTGLVASYPLDGNAVDIGEHGLHGTVSGALPTRNRKGIDGKALYFNSSFVRVPHSPLLEFAMSDFTVCAWIKPEGDLVDYSGIVVKCTPQAPEIGYQLVVHSDNHLGAQIGVRADVGSYFDVKAAYPLSQNWHFVSMVVSRATRTVRLYVDGFEVAVKVDQRLATTIAESEPVYFGRERRGVVWFRGAIDDVSFYQGALTQNQIRELALQ